MPFVTSQPAIENCLVSILFFSPIVYLKKQVGLAKTVIKKKKKKKGRRTSSDISKPIIEGYTHLKLCVTGIKIDTWFRVA